jgi:hypothetical protein
MTAPKRKPALSSSQIAFSFDPPVRPRAVAGMAGIERRVSAAVAMILKDSADSRHVIAARMSEMMDEEISHFMLDGYASEARDRVNISVGRFLALIAATNRQDMLDALVREAGAAVLIGEEIQLALLGDLDTRINDLIDQRERLRASVKPMGRN